MLKKILSVIVLSIILSACSLMPKTQDQNLNLDQPLPESPSQAPQKTGTVAGATDTVVAINTKHGQIVLKLFPDQAPDTVKNFLAKVNSGFYNGLSFHRVEPGFVVQGGDPLGNGTGGGTIASEINDIPFETGSLGLARGSDIKVSSDSQFFICLATDTCSQLTKLYVNFGQVLSGQDVVAKISKNDSIISATTTTK